MIVRDGPLCSLASSSYAYRCMLFADLKNNLSTDLGTYSQSRISLRVPFLALLLDGQVDSMHYKLRKRLTGLSYAQHSGNSHREGIAKNTVWPRL